MKKGFFGILALTLIFGMAVVGCDDGNDDEEFVSTIPSKQIKLTNSVAFATGYYVAGVHDENNNIAGCVDVYLNGTEKEITFILKTANQDGIVSENNWTGSGEYFLQIVRYNQTGQAGTDPSEVSANAWVYTNGDSNKQNMVKIDFTSNVITLDMSKFAVTTP